MNKIFNRFLIHSVRKMDTSPKIPACVLDPSGTFKYIQIKVKYPGDPPKVETVVRGFKRFGYHMDIYT